MIVPIGSMGSMVYLALGKYTSFPWKLWGIFQAFTASLLCLFLLSYITILLGTLVLGVALADRNEDLNEAWDGYALEV